MYFSGLFLLLRISKTIEKMKFPSNNSNVSSLFYDELLTLYEKFEKFSHCERAIAICSMLQLFNYPSLRFIQSKIEATFAQSACSEDIKWMEQQSNSKSYIDELCGSYKLLSVANSDVQLINLSPNIDAIYNDPDRLIIGENITNLINSNSSNSNISNSNSNNTINSSTTTINTTTTSNNNNTNTNNLNHYSSKNSTSSDKFSKKEDILNDVLNYILMLKIGNDEATKVYLSLIPFMVADARNGIVSIEIVQQILSVLVAHPSLSSEARKWVNKQFTKTNKKLKKKLLKENRNKTKNIFICFIASMGSFYFVAPLLEANIVLFPFSFLLPCWAFF